MNKISEIRSIEDLKEYIFLNKESIKRAALPVTVVAALLFFWIGGGEPEEEIIVTESDASAQIQESGDLEEAIVMYVDISGCVNNPGVYEVKEGTRVFQLIDKAGGLTDDADIEELNRAEEVYDGQKIIIYSQNDEESQTNSSGVSSSGKININRADTLQLQNIPGVGPATAQKIIEYRQSNGSFKSVDELKNVSGIGDKTFESMKEYITV